MDRQARVELMVMAKVVFIVLLAAVIAIILVILFYGKPAHGAETNAVTGSFVVTGYEPKKYAVDDDKMRQIDLGIGIIEKDLAKVSGGVLKVLVYGSADITGASAGNDPLSDNRAKPVAAILRHRLPQGALVEVVPRGDSENARQVRVEWKYISIPVASTPVAPVSVSEKKKFDNFGWLIATTCAAIVGIGVLLFLFKGRVLSELSPDKSVTRWLEVAVDGRKFSVKIEYDHGKIVSPFKTRSGYKITKSENDLKRMIDSLKGCLRKNEFASQREILIRLGVIIDKT